MRKGGYLTFVLCCLMVGHVQAQVDWQKIDLHDSQAVERLLTTRPAADHGRIEVLLGHIYTDQSVELASQHFDRAELQLATDDLAGHAVLMSGRCVLRMLNAEMDAATALCERGVELADRSGDQFAQLRAYAAITNVVYQSGRLELAREYAERALAAARESRDAVFVATQLNNLGLISQAQGSYKAAMQYFREGIDALSERVDHPLFYPLSFNLGVSYADLEQHDLAQELYQPALNWTRENGLYRKELIVIVYAALSDIALDRAPQAEQSLLAALERPELLANRGYLGFVYAALGHAQFAQQKNMEAIASYERGLAIAATDPNTFEQRRLDIGYAQALAAVGRLDEAAARLQSVIARLDAEGSRHLQRSALETMLAVSRQVGDLEGSLRVFEELMELQDQVELFELEQELALARAAYEVNSKERELVAAERDAIVRNGAIMLLLAFGIIGYLYVTRRVEMQRRQVQGELARRLEEKVDERTRELRARMDEAEAADKARREMERQLSEAEKLRVLGQLTGGVAHDFNNLLTVVIGAAELLKVGVDEAKRADLLAHIVTAAESGADITRALMAYARKQPLQMETVELGRFLRERVPLIRRTMGGTVTVTLAIVGNEGIDVHIDPAQLTTALLNLALNARDAQEHKGDICVTLERRDSGFAEISVIDAGTGMTAEQLEHAVEPFYTTKNDNQGNGLGLSMVYGFSKQSGGDLEIESVPGKGTTVRLVLPLKQVERETDDAEAEVRVREVELPVPDTEATPNGQLNIAANGAYNLQHESAEQEERQSGEQPEQVKNIT